MMERDQWIERAFATAGAGFFLLLLSFFSLRIFSYYRQIQRGEIDFSGLKFSATAVHAADLSDLVKTAPGTGELASKDDPSLGSPDAKVTVVEFADFGCPFSQQESYVVRALAKEFPDTVRFIYRDFPLPDLHPGADLAAAGGSCAMDQGKFWEFHDVLYAHSGEFTQENLAGYAEDAGLDADTFSSCLASGRYQTEVANDQVDGVNAGVVGTPTFFINGSKVEGAIPYAIFKEALKAFAQN